MSQPLNYAAFLKHYFKSHAEERTAYRLLPRLMKHKADIESAAYAVATKHFCQTFTLALYDVTTLYFESHKPNDELLAKGFSRNDKSNSHKLLLAY